MAEPVGARDALSASDDESLHNDSDFCQKVARKLGKVALFMDEFDNWDHYADNPFFEVQRTSVDARLDKLERNQTEILDLLRGLARRIDGLSLCSSGGGSGSLSPMACSFACPLCLQPQRSPKAHCEHLKKVASEKGECAFMASNPRHDSILRVFGSAAAFVQWFVANYTIMFQMICANPS
jgi:hypothetical protein